MESSEDRLKLLPHSVHRYGLSPVWSLMWYLSPDEPLNDFPHSEQRYGLSVGNQHRDTIVR